MISLDKEHLASPLALILILYTIYSLNSDWSHSIPLRYVISVFNDLKTSFPIEPEDCDCQLIGPAANLATP
jgi:hypothetical protein